MATNCLTGEAAFFERGKCADIMRAARASASVPLIAPFVRFAGIPYLDGSIALSAPVDWALEQGYDKVVAVLTRHKGFRKPPVTRGQRELSEVRYRRYPNLVRAMRTNSLRYNRQMTHFDELEAEGKIFIIRPQWPITISNLERDTLRLRLLYEQGRKEAEAGSARAAGIFGNIKRIAAISTCRDPSVFKGRPRLSLPRALPALPSQSPFVQRAGGASS